MNTYLLIALSSLACFTAGFAACWGTQSEPQSRRIDAADEILLRIESEASVAKQSDQVHDAAALEHNIRLARRALNGDPN